MFLIALFATVTVEAHDLEQDAPDSIVTEITRQAEVTIGSTRPTATVVRRVGGSSDTIAIYAMRIEDSAANQRQFQWVFRRAISEAGTENTTFVRLDACPSLYDAVIGLDRLPLPNLEIRPSATGSPTGYSPPPPSIGALHQSYALLAGAWSETNERNGIILTHLGAGRLKVWFDQLDLTWSGCPTMADLG